MSANIEQRISSQIQRVPLNGRMAYEKQYVVNDWDDDFGVIQERAIREARLLDALANSDHFGRRLGVPEVAKTDPEKAILATFEIPGASLGQLIINDRKVAADLRPWFLAGKWLRQLQLLRVPETASTTKSRRDPSNLVEYCELRIRTLKDYGYRWPSKAIQHRMLKKLEDLNSRVPNDIIPVWVHADYSPGNLMWDGQTLTPIDFAMARPGLPLDDATYLIHRIEMSRVYRPWISLPIARIRDAILRGLGRPNAKDSEEYQLLMFKHQICRLHTYVRRPAKNKKQLLHDRWVRAILRHSIRSTITSQDQHHEQKTSVN